MPCMAAAPSNVPSAFMPAATSPAAASVGAAGAAAGAGRKLAVSRSGLPLLERRFLLLRSDAFCCAARVCSPSEVTMRWANSGLLERTKLMQGSSAS